MEAVESLIGDAQRRGWAWQVAREARGLWREAREWWCFLLQAICIERFLRWAAAGLGCWALAFNRRRQGQGRDNGGRGGLEEEKSFEFGSTLDPH